MTALRPVHLMSTSFFFIDTATTEIYTLSLHDALPILPQFPAHHPERRLPGRQPAGLRDVPQGGQPHPDRKSTRLNSSHVSISYAVFCLKKKKSEKIITHQVATALLRGRLITNLLDKQR